MQYFGRAIGSVSKTWNSINPATLSGAIDVIVVEQENGELHCSPFHVRFGKFSLLRPSQKKVVFSVNGQQVNLPMKLSDGGEAFFVFETNNPVPDDLLTSPVISPTISPSSSPPSEPVSPNSQQTLLQEPDFLNLDGQTPDAPRLSPSLIVPTSPGSKEQAIERARLLTKRLTNTINVPSKITDNGDIVLDMTGYKADQEEINRSEKIVRQLLEEEFGSAPNVCDLFGADEEGNLRIYSGDDYLAGGYTSDDARSDLLRSPVFNDENSVTSIDSAGENSQGVNEEDADNAKPNGELSHFKSLRLTSEQLKCLHLKEGMNDITFSVNQGKAVCASKMFYWKHDVPIVISDIDGTITKSDALGHVLAMIGRDWTHVGVAKLFADISSNGYNVMYLTARSVGQAHSTRSYLQSVEQDGIRLPSGPVILSPDRTMAALRREVIMRQPEVFKMACLRDIKSLYGEREGFTPFYAGFGNRITDALSYRSVGIPSSRIFTINTYGDVHMELMELAGVKSSYIYITDLVDHFFPPAKLLSLPGGDNYTDVNYWRDPVLELSDLDDSDQDTSSPNNKFNDEDDVDDYESRLATSPGAYPVSFMELNRNKLNDIDNLTPLDDDTYIRPKISTDTAAHQDQSHEDYDDEDYDEEYDEEYDEDYDDDDYDEEEEEEDYGDEYDDDYDEESQIQEELRELEKQELDADLLFEYETDTTKPVDIPDNEVNPRGYEYSTAKKVVDDVKIVKASEALKELALS
ncbi:LNS2-domain-containing protein [Nadsonia fulvescens var. elongata DSM 6958]|uniref:LNS2-domain-containing protein n=1 Tax=Nadsonia fulvescens var. elongata DSM 6958 TaxID=857566 RepID=A0A1E3PPY4_9ASCO|nr:LNS2-domain-containing protein [Nadsonia fulvescens var. elongata DSM 6958]